MNNPGIRYFGRDVGHMPLDQMEVAEQLHLNKVAPFRVKSDKSRRITLVSAEVLARLHKIFAETGTVDLTRPAKVLDEILLERGETETRSGYSGFIKTIVNSGANGNFDIQVSFEGPEFEDESVRTGFLDKLKEILGERRVFEQFDI